MTPKSQTSDDKRIALFAGSFNPFTVGHASLVERGLELFDKVVIAIGVNSAKTDDGEAEARCRAIADLYADRSDRVNVIVNSDRLTVDVAASVGARWLLRGVRSVKDFEYERDLADINRQISGLETIILFTLPQHGAISSSVVRELQAYGHDVADFVPHKTLNNEQ